MTLVTFFIFCSFWATSQCQLLEGLVASSTFNLLDGTVRLLFKCLSLAETNDKWLGKLSLGGQTVGEVGKYVREKTGKLIKECHAMDPAGPLFDGGHNDMILDKGDCKVVQIIHTSAAQSVATSGPETLLQRLGTAKKSGHCDFWVNCGHFQEAKCLAPSLGSILSSIKKLLEEQEDGKLMGIIAEDTICSHVRSAILYRNAVTNKCKYDSYKCKDCGMGPKGDLCSAEGPVANSLPPNSKCDHSLDINYYMKTTGSGNYCSVKS